MHRKRGKSFNLKKANQMLEKHHEKKALPFFILLKIFYLFWYLFLLRIKNLFRNFNKLENLLGFGIVNNRTAVWESFQLIIFDTFIIFDII